MKKIYILTAIFALLTLSLNAQLAPNRADLLLTGWDYPGSFPTTWTVPSTGSGSVGGYYFGGYSGADIIIPSSDLQGNTTVTVKLTAAKENGNAHSVSVNDVTSSPALTTSLVELTWENVNASSGITIHVSDYYVNISSIHVYAPITDPTITASTNSVSMNAAPGGTATETVTVTGYNLTDNITAAISGTDAAVFSVNPSSLGTSGGSLTVTYSPSAPGNHSATLTLTSTGETVTITLNGSCVAGTTYELVTDPSTQLVDGEKYIIVHGNYAMGALSGNSGYGTVVAITDNGNGTVTVPGTSSAMVLTLHNYSSNYTSGYTFTLDNGSYLKPAASNSSNLTTATTSSDNNCWNPVADVKSTGGYGLKSYLTTSRALGFQESSSVTARFAFYSTNNLTANSTTYFYGLLYREVSNTPKIEITPEIQTINDAAAGTLTVTGTNVEGNINVSVDNTTDWYLDPTSFTSTGGNASVSYTGRALSASTTVTAEAANDNTVTDEATVNYVADLYIVTDNGVTGNWDFTNGTQMTNNDGTYTATFTATADNTYILFARKLGNDVDWNTRYVFGPDSGGDWWLPVDGNGSGNIDVNDDDPIKIQTAGTYTITINSDGTFTITKQVPVLTAPENNSTVNVGTNTGSGVSKTINIKGENLTQDLTVSVSGTGFGVSRDITVTAAEANAGKDITVTYDGTAENATGTLTISSSEVSATVNLTATYSDNGAIDVANGTTTSMYLPVYGSYYEQVQKNQMIYPASMLSDLEGKYITSITFYPAPGTLDNGTAVSGIMFSGGKVMLSLGNTSNNSFTSNAAISATVTQVAEIDNVQQDQNLTAWTFTFDTPYHYEGGNLLVQVDTEVGEYYRTFFYGTTMSNMGRHQYGSTGGLDNFLPKATFTYQSNAPVVPAVEGGLLRLHLLFCDQLMANIPEDNSHPDAYGYVLRYEPNGPQGAGMKESGRVKVDIQKTDCEVLGYYTLDQIDLDKHIGTDHKQGLTMDVTTAQVEFNLSATNDKLNYYYLQGKENGLPALGDDYLSQLHRQEDFTYREMYTESDEFDQVFESGKHYYFNNGTPILTGEYGNANKYVSYAPSVTTWGIQRRYFELDGYDNTYGGPIWKTNVGMVTMDTHDVTLMARRQTNTGHSVNWTDPTTQSGASIYILDGIGAIGKLPHTDLTKVKFEPYMFRVFVESPNGKLRPYKYVTEAESTSTTQPGNHFEPADGALTEEDTKGPLCVWSGYVKYDDNGNVVYGDYTEDGVTFRTGTDEGQTTYIYHKNKVDRPAGSTDAWNLADNNAIFAALDNVAISGFDQNGQPIAKPEIDANDLTVFVRFYFNVKGMAADHVVMGRAGEAARPGNGSESPGLTPDPWTAVNEVVYDGEIVSRTYVNALGMQSDEPFDGVNIVVTRYSDGKVSTTKVIR